MKRTPLALYESLLAAVEGGDERERVRALRRRLAARGVATRNVRDFAHLGVEVVDPWTLA